MFKCQLVTALFFGLSTMFTPLQADDVTDSIQEATEAYAKGDNAKAIGLKISGGGGQIGWRYFTSRLSPRE
jgi:hypothetical protein